MSEEEVIKQIKDMIIAFDVQGYIREKGVIKEELKASNVLQEMLDLYNKQKEEIERLKNDKKKEEQEARIWIKMMNNLIDPKEVSKVIDQELNRLNPTK